MSGAENAAENPDPLLDVVHQYPEEAAWFIKAGWAWEAVKVQCGRDRLQVVMFFGSISGVVISIPCGLFLTMCSSGLAALLEVEQTSRAQVLGTLWPLQPAT